MVLVVKNLPANAGDVRDTGSIPGWGRSLWRRAWQSMPVFWPGESHGQRSLAGYSLHRVVKSWKQLKQLSTHEPGLANENLCDWFRFGCLTRAG